MKWRLGDININHLRFIPHSLSLHGKEQAVYSSKFLLLCPTEVIHIWNDKRVRFFFCVNYSCKHEKWVIVLTNRVSILPHFNDYILFSTRLYLDVLGSVLNEHAGLSAAIIYLTPPSLVISSVFFFSFSLLFTHIDKLAINTHTIFWAKRLPSAPALLPHWQHTVIPLWPVWASSILKLPLAVADLILLLYSLELITLSLFSSRCIMPEVDYETGPHWLTLVKYSLSFGTFFLSVSF